MSDNAMKKCVHCSCIKIAHLQTEKRSYCLAVGCKNCPGFEAEPEPEVKPPMFAVRIDRTDAGYTFKTESIPHGIEMIALDSTPGVIAFVEAPNPGAACALAWERGQRELASLGGLSPSPPEKLLELLGDKKPDGGSP